MQYLYAGIMPAFLFVVLFFWIASPPATNERSAGYTSECPRH
jgi:hypothetical protein